MRLGICACVLALCVFEAARGGSDTVIHRDIVVSSSSTAGAGYGPDRAVDGNEGTRWASRDHAKTPQWLELRFDEPRMVDYVYLHLYVDAIYASWAELELSFSDGAPISHSLDMAEDVLPLRFPARETSFVRISVTRVHEPRHYVGIAECFCAYDPESRLTLGVNTPKPVPYDELLIRGRPVHPCVNMTPEDVAAAKARVEKEDWARERRDVLVKEAEAWLREDAAYWLAFLPAPGACYAYGFTACPICDGKTGTWHRANCSWEKPGQVTCANGHVLPDAAHPDEGVGYTAPDGRVHYFTGQFNAWVTEQWTLYALPALSQAYLLTDDARFAERAALLLDGLASVYKESTSGSWDYPSNPPSGRFARPWYQVARTLVKYVDYYDRLYHSPALNKPSLRPGITRRENIERNMLLDGAYYCYPHSFKGALHNGHADYMRGALAVGCLLDIPEFIRIAVEGPFSIHTMLANNIDRDGRYYESSLGYAIHARRLYLTYGDPLFNLRNAEYPEGLNLYDHPALRAAILLPDTQTMLAGRRPNFGDSAPDFKYIPPAPPLANASDIAFLERLYARTADAQRRAEYAALLRWCAREGQGVSRRDTDARGNPRPHGDVDWLLWHARGLDTGKAQDAALPAPYAQRAKGAWVAGMKGMAILRAGDQAVLLRYGPSLNHGDLDDLGLLYYAKGYELSYDIGYGLGSTHCQVGWASSTAAHCLVTVNEKNQLGAGGSGGSLHWFAALPGVQAVAASSESSYAAEDVTTYRRELALVGGRYLVDAFRVEGGSQHDFGFGCIGTGLEPFGVDTLEASTGSLAEEYEWGRKVGADGDIKGHPNKPYWNPPPGNGYGFFKDVRRGTPAPHWGGQWTVAGEPGLKMRMHVVGDAQEAIFANAPGLYPNKPEASYIIARQRGEEPLASAFLAVYEPFGESPALSSVKRVGPLAIEVQCGDAMEVVLFGSQTVETGLGPVRFEGDFAYLIGRTRQVLGCETLGCARLDIDGRKLPSLPGAFEAQVVDLDLDACSVQLDKNVPDTVGKGLCAIFSNPAYGRNTAYHVKDAGDDVLRLEAGTFSLGLGRVSGIKGAQTLLSDIPHEYAKNVRRTASGFFDGKTIRGEGGGSTRVLDVQPGSPITMTVEDAAAFRVEEQFTYLDIAPGDTVRIALPKIWNFGA